jgi:streptogramin lyase
MMNRRVLIQCFVVGIVPALAMLWAGARVRATEYVAEDTELNPSGTAYEVNADEDGNLWVSDFSADEIRQINPATGVYTIYQGLSSPSDARADGAGNAWWSDSNNRLRRLALGSGLVTTWTLPAGRVPLGTAVDAAGNVWVTDSTNPLLHRFDPATTQLCSYAVPDGGISNYIVADGTDIWLSDHVVSRILRLEPASGDFTMWDLPWSSFINGIGVDKDGNIWVAESGDHSLLAQLEPQINQLTAYTLPVGIWPEMLVVHEGLVWYSEDNSGTVGVLDPAAANGVASTLVVSTEQVTPSCSILGPGSSAAAVTSSSTATWSASVLTNVVDSDGWTVYSLPAGSAPWGITVLDEDVFVVDQGRQRLVRISAVSWSLYLPIVMRE